MNSPRIRVEMQKPNPPLKDNPDFRSMPYLRAPRFSACLPQKADTVEGTSVNTLGIAAKTLSAPNRTRAGSPTTPLPGQSDAGVLDARRTAWDRRPLTRDVYRRYFEDIRAELAPGRTHVEIGGGAGHLKASLPHVRVSDLVPTPYVDFAADAMHLPLPDRAADNLILVDVLHHLPRPIDFLREACRTLRIGGRIVMLEPYISPLSRAVFRAAHPEPVDLRADVFKKEGPVFDSCGPFSSNQAIPTLLFFKHADRLQSLIPELRVVTRKLDSVFVYPLSGGFSGPCLIPGFARAAAWRLEALARPLRRWLAFRMLVTLERAPVDTPTL